MSDTDFRDAIIQPGLVMIERQVNRPVLVADPENGGVVRIVDGGIRKR